MQINKVYFENLDALRFFAFLLVFISHASLLLGFNPDYWKRISRTFFEHGDLGVSFFFVLSGFLITFLLMSEKSADGISLRHFYIRRVLRIWPLYFLVLAIGFFAIPALNISNLPENFRLGNLLTELPWHVFFGSNFLVANHVFPSVIIIVLWSISIEEQFYIIWPLVMRKIRAHGLKWILLSVVVISTFYRYFHFPDYSLIRFSTFSVFSDLAIGALGAILTYTSNNFVNFFRSLPRFLTIIPYILFVGTAFIRTRSQAFLVPDYVYIANAISAFLPVLFATIFIFIILEQSYARNSFIKFGRIMALTYLGRISYGLYVYHMIAFLIVLKSLELISIEPTSNDPIYFIIKVIFSFSVSIVMALFSYRFIEQPFLRLKKRFGYKKL